MTVIRIAVTILSFLLTQNVHFAANRLYCDNQMDTNKYIDKLAFQACGLLFQKIESH